MSVIINGVSCEERAVNFSEEFELLHGPTARKGFFVPNWGDRYKVVVGLLGLSSTTKIGGRITLQTPSQWPEIPTMYAHRISIQPHGSPTSGGRQIQYPSCTVWADYGVMPWSFNPFDNQFNQLDPTRPLVFAEQRMSSSIEWIDVPGSALYWKTTPAALQQPGKYRVALVNMEITLKFLPYLPTYEVLASAGCCNDAPYLGVDTGKLAFNGVTTAQGAVSDGTFTQEGTYSFTARTQRWDYSYDWVNKLWDQVQISIGGSYVPLVPSFDFTQIIPSDYVY